MMSTYEKIVVLLIAAVLAIGGYIYLNRSSSSKQGGIRIVMQAATDSLPKNPKARARTMDAVVKVIESRTQALGGVAAPSVQTKGDDQIIIELPGFSDKAKAIQTLAASAILEFYWLRDLQSQKNPSGKWKRLTSEIDEKTGEEIYAFKNKTTKKIIKDDTEEGRKQILLQVANAYDPVENKKGVKPLLSGSDLLPKSEAHLNTQTKGAVVLVKFNDHGREIFRDFTRKHVGDVVAIFIGGRLLTAPVINEAIPSGSAEISGFKNLQEAKSTAELLNAGALPVQLQIISVSDL